MDKQLKDAFTLMRIPFSVFLLPIYWFALSNTPNYDTYTALLIFVVLHIFVYPASNGYNSYYDKDEDSIGGIKQPPKVNEKLYWLVIAFDVIAIALALCVNITFALLMLVCLLLSKAYSYDKIRLKKYPILSTIITTVFQGSIVYASIQIGLGLSWEYILSFPNWLFALFSTLFLCGSYPITQIYQHDEDRKRGDITLSILLGIWGTFAFAVLSFTLSIVVLAIAYWHTGNLYKLGYFLPFILPVLGFLLYWMYLVKQNPAAVNYENTMKMSAISSLCFNLAFIFMLWL